MVLLIDNYDSFVHNLARYLRRLGAEVVVLRNDSSLLYQYAREATALVISPGPCGPEQAGECLGLVRELSGRIPILGICLGHQVICQAFGGKVVRAMRPIHGMSLPIELYPSQLFEGLKPVTHFARYHSLIADASSLPASLKVIARSLVDDPSNSEIMAVEHQDHPTFGVQFHPESILSTGGYRVLSNFLKLSGVEQERVLPDSDLISARSD